MSGPPVSGCSVRAVEPRPHVVVIRGQWPGRLEMCWQAVPSQFASGMLAGMTDQPPNGLPSYRLLTGPDDEKFCRRVSEALDLGFRLHGSPAVTFDGDRVIAAQAVVWPGTTAG